MTDSRPLSEACDYPALIEALRARKDELGLSNETVDDLAGFTAGHADKLLGPTQRKSLGPLSLGLLLRVLAVKIVLVEDTEAAAAMDRRWDQRKRAPVESWRASTTLKNRIKPVVLSEMGKEMRAHQLTKQKPSTRRRIARNAARARWGKPKRRTKRHKRAAPVSDPAPSTLSQA